MIQTNEGVDKERRPRSRLALLHLFAPGTPASATAAAGESGDVDEFAAPFGRSGRAAGDAAVAGGGGEPDAQPARRGHRRVVQPVDGPADVARANPFTPPPAGPAATWR